MRGFVLGVGQSHPASKRSVPKACFRFEQPERYDHQVLHNSDEVEPVAGTRKSAQAKMLEAMMGLRWPKHIYPLPLIARFGECLGARETSRAFSWTSRGILLEG